MHPNPNPSLSELIKSVYKVSDLIPLGHKPSELLESGCRKEELKQYASDLIKSASKSCSIAEVLQDSGFDANVLYQIGYSVKEIMDLGFWSYPPEPIKSASIKKLFSSIKDVAELFSTIEFFNLTNARKSHIIPQYKIIRGILDGLISDDLLLPHRVFLSILYHFVDNRIKSNGPYASLNALSRLFAHAMLKKHPISMDQLFSMDPKDVDFRKNWFQQVKETISLTTDWKDDAGYRPYNTDDDLQYLHCVTCHFTFGFDCFTTEGHYELAKLFFNMGEYEIAAQQYVFMTTPSYYNRQYHRTLYQKSSIEGGREQNNDFPFLHHQAALCYVEWAKSIQGTEQKKIIFQKAIEQFKKVCQKPVTAFPDSYGSVEPKLHVDFANCYQMLGDLRSALYYLEFAKTLYQKELSSLSDGTKNLFFLWGHYKALHPGRGEELRSLISEIDKEIGFVLESITQEEKEIADWVNDGYSNGSPPPPFINDEKISNKSKPR